MLNFYAVEAGYKPALAVQHAGHIADQHKVFCANGTGQRTGRRVGIDVQGFAVRARGHRGHHGHKSGVQQAAGQGGVNGFYRAHKAKGRIFDRGTQQAAVPARNARRAHALLGKFVDNGLVDLAAQHHFCGLHGGGVGHAQAVHKVAFDIQALEQGRNLRTAAVHNHKIHTLFRELRKVGGKGRAEVGLVHGVAAVFNNHSGIFHLVFLWLWSLKGRSFAGLSPQLCFG